MTRFCHRELLSDNSSRQARFLETVILENRDKDALSLNGLQVVMSIKRSFYGWLLIKLAAVAARYFH
jgi:hypothetical protein